MLLCYRRTVLDNLDPASSSSKFRKDRLDSGIKWRKMPISGRRGLTKLSADGVKELLYTLVKSDWRWYFWVLRSAWSKKCQKKAIFRTLSCRQLGRRGLNRKTKSTSRFFGPNYPPVQNFSEKNDKKFLGTISVFFVPLYKV